MTFIKYVSALNVIFVGLYVLLTSSPVWADKPHAQGYWIWAGVPLKNPDPKASLYLFQGHFRKTHSGIDFAYEGPPPRPLAQQIGPVILTYRLSTLPPPERVARHYRQHKWAWEKDNVAISGIQIDFDSPTARLGAYAQWLGELRKELDDSEELSITGLGDWLLSASPKMLKQLSQPIDFIAFMIYHEGRSLNPIAPYARHLSKLSLPFRLGVLETQSGMVELRSIRTATGYRGDITFLMKEP